MATQHIFTINDVYRKSLEGTWTAQGWGYGWFGGGYAPGSGFKSSIFRWSMTDDTAAAVARGSVVANSTRGGAASTNQDGWLVHGANAAPPAASFAASSLVSRVIFSSDTAVSTAKGNLDTAKLKFAGSVTDHSTAGWFSGGYGVAPGYTTYSSSSKLTFSSDTATTVAKGVLSTARNAGNGIDNRSTIGYYLGGNAGASDLSIVDKIIFASDTAAMVAKGNLSVGGRSPGGTVGNTTDGWNCGIYMDSTGTSTSRVDRIIFATDTAAAVNKGPLSAVRLDNVSGVSNPSGTIGWVSGGTSGLGGAATYTNKDRITFATDTATAVAKGSGLTAVNGGANLNQ